MVRRPSWKRWIRPFDSLPRFSRPVFLLVSEVFEDLRLLVELARWLFCFLQKCEEGRVHILIHFLQLRNGENRSEKCHAALSEASCKKEKLFACPQLRVVSFVCLGRGRIVRRTLWREIGESATICEQKGNSYFWLSVGKRRHLGGRK